MSVSLIAASLAVTLGASAAGQGTAQPLSPVQNLTTFCVRVEESYWAYNPTEVRIKSVSLPFRDDAARLLRLTGLREADSCRVVLRITAKGTAEGRKYRHQRADASGAGVQFFSGARLEGSVSVEVDGRKVAERPFRGRKTPPDKIYSAPATPDRAPFVEVYRGGNTQFEEGSFPVALASIVSAVFGEEPLLAESVQPQSSMAQPALKVLLQRKSASLFDLMVRALRDGDPKVRARAAYALGEIRDNRALGELSVAFRDRDELVRINAAQAIQKIEGKQ